LISFPKELKEELEETTGQKRMRILKKAGSCLKHSDYQGTYQSG
jgi:hypothetical protein